MQEPRGSRKGRGREKTRRDSEKSTALDDGSNGLGGLVGWLGGGGEWRVEKNLRKV